MTQQRGGAPRRQQQAAYARAQNALTVARLSLHYWLEHDATELIDWTRGEATPEELAGLTELERVLSPDSLNGHIHELAGLAETGRLAAAMMGLEPE
jgi:hypothetical protein